jgi:hypothetical protein
MNVPFLLIFAHFMGDFVFQTDEMAVNKSKSWGALTEHVAWVTWALFLVLPTLIPEFPGLGPVLAFLGVNFAAHFLIDAVTSRITSKLWFIELEPTVLPLSGGFTHYAKILPTRHWFFVMIGFDQLLHYITLALTYQFCF